jgi:DNA polymerase sigma
MPLAMRLLDNKMLVELGKRFIDFLEYFGTERYDELVECADALHARYGDSTPDTQK